MRLACRVLFLQNLSQIEWENTSWLTLSSLVDSTTSVSPTLCYTEEVDEVLVTVLLVVQGYVAILLELL